MTDSLKIQKQHLLVMVKQIIKVITVFFIDRNGDHAKKNFPKVYLIRECIFVAIYPWNSFTTEENVSGNVRMKTDFKDEVWQKLFKDFFIIDFCVFLLGFVRDSFSIDQIWFCDDIFSTLISIFSPQNVSLNFQTIKNSTGTILAIDGEEYSQTMFILIVWWQ